ncbi:MAG TPA: hypothetical protein VHK91_12330 [Flavisolibacter sp.]|nr:hypothetical protein [Flavisolibacter sp.]
MKRILLLLLLPATRYAAAQEPGSPALVPDQLKSYSRRQVSALAFWGNAAGLAGQAGWSAGLISERRFLLKELSRTYLSLAGPLGKGQLALAGSYGGAPDYHTGSFGLGYALALGEVVRAAVQFQYVNQHISGSESPSAVTAGAGLQFQLTDKVQAGLAVHNIRSRETGPETLPLPFTYEAGWGADISEQLYLGAFLQKAAGEPVSVHVGADYRLLPEVGLVLGISSASDSYYFGGHYQFKTFRLQLAASVHPKLGITPALTLIYQRKPTDD